MDMTAPKTNRRYALTLLGAGVAMPVLAACGVPASAAQANPLKLSDSQWRSRLSDAEYNILREAGTERPFTSPLNEEKRKGVFTCAGCDNPLYSSATKFESGTGWPSFYQSLNNAVGYSTDLKIGYPRREVHCAKCGGHLGHVFDDGPPPTGKRHCINGIALDFRPA
jgi:peptide-methionine (R)-S-oxide reductase